MQRFKPRTIFPQCTRFSRQLSNIPGSCMWLRIQQKTLKNSDSCKSYSEKTWHFKNYKLGRPVIEKTKKKKKKQKLTKTKPPNKPQTKKSNKWVKKLIMGLSAKYHRISSVPPYPHIISSLRGEFHWQASQKKHLNPQHRHSRESSPRGQIPPLGRGW